ncbi:MAG TPA: hypothetical protein VE176_14735, partial [Candidatus Limnocylindrales bacterium]|nr:hypothetical protein [Candidatus Limnocylindrales bacterium]
TDVPLVSIEVFLMLRIRHCVECPKCLTRYLIAFSPYSNGSYLVPTVYGSSEEYILSLLSKLGFERRG